MGSSKGRANENRVHTVTIARPFYMGKYEVTQAQWRAVMGDNFPFLEEGDLPVGNVSWNDAREFI
jgi:formylglycine-generating enzyme required for sulfatase activity